MTTNDHLSELADADAHVHVESRGQLIAIFLVLVALTLLSVAASRLDVGAWEVYVSMGIAAAKASLVALYFMHLRYDTPFNTIALVTAILCLALFLSLTLADVEAYSIGES